MLRITCFLGVLALVCGDCPRDVDPCSSSVYTELDEPSRSINFTVTSAPESDYYTSMTWYRAVSGAGGDMPTSVVHTGQCNAYAPIYLTDSLPGAEDGIVDITACASFLFDPCVREYTVAVKNCTDYNVYCLSPVNDAYDRYCIGTELACEPGYTSPNGFTPGCELVEATTAEDEPSDTVYCPRDVNPCDAYTELDEPTRSTRYNVTDSNEGDYTRSEAWYRSVSGAGGDMPTSPVHTGQCNAFAPIWLADDLPEEGDGIVDLTACASFLEDDCVREYTVPVRNCGTYNVYCLHPVADVYDRYCMGSEIACPAGYTSETGFTPNCEIIETTTGQEETTTESEATTAEDDSKEKGKKIKLESINKKVIVIVSVAIAMLLAFIAGAIVAYYWKNRRNGVNNGTANQPVSGSKNQATGAMQLTRHGVSNVNEKKKTQFSGVAVENQRHHDKEIGVFSHLEQLPSRPGSGTSMTSTTSLSAPLNRHGDPMATSEMDSGLSSVGT